MKQTWTAEKDSQTSFNCWCICSKSTSATVRADSTSSVWRWRKGSVSISCHLRPSTYHLVHTFFQGSKRSAKASLYTFLANTVCHIATLTRMPGHAGSSSSACQTDCCILVACSKIVAHSCKFLTVYDPCVA